MGTTYFGWDCPGWRDEPELAMAGSFFSPPSSFMHVLAPALAALVESQHW